MNNNTKWIVALLVIVATCLGGACGGGDDKSKNTKKSSKKSSSKESTKSVPKGGIGPVGGKIDMANAGSISGKLRFEGTVPEPKVLDTSKDSWCAANSKVMSEELVVDNNGGLRDVFVYIEGLDKYGSKMPYGDKPARIVQKGCRYIPHVVGVRVDQDLEVVNADDNSHNYHFMGRANDEINKTQPKPATNVEVFESAELSASLTCDIHPWMSATLHIMDHPCFAVSSEDGSFTINGVPPGKYKLHFLHANAKAGQTGMEVTVSAKGKKDVGEIKFN